MAASKTELAARLEWFINLISQAEFSSSDLRGKTESILDSAVEE